MRYWIGLLFCFFTTHYFCQEIDHIDINEINKGFRAPDSLIKLSYIDIDQQFNIYFDYFENSISPINHSEKLKNIAKTYIEKAKRNKDSFKIGYGYSLLSRLNEWNIAYADTCIYFTKNSNKSDYPSICYSLKIAGLFINGDYKEAMKNSILNYNYVSQNENIELKYLAKSYINILNADWGDKLNAIEGYKEELSFIRSDLYKEIYPAYSEENILSDYTSKIYDLSLSFISINELDLAKIYIDSGYHYTDKYSLDKKEQNSFLGLYGPYLYRVGKYERALDSLNKFISLDEKDDLYSQSSSAVYKGLILNKLNRQEEAIAQIKYADSLYQITDDEFEELTEGYKLLVDHYKTTGDETSQLMYLNKLIKLDSVITSNYITTNAAITKNYTIPELEREKEAAIARLEAKNEQAGWGLWGLGSGLLLALGVGGYYFKTQRQYKQRFKAIVAQSEQVEDKEVVESVTPKPQENPLDPELVKRLDLAIKAFEDEEGFTATKITQKSLAEDLQTNSAYLSRYINQYKGKNFAQYLISLRINYAIQRLQKDKVLRSYTVDAIAEECGFGNSKSFTKAFKAATGLNPSYFIRNIDKGYAA